MQVPTSTVHDPRFPNRHRRGSATVEFAVVLPILLLMLAGIIEFGQAFRIKHALSNACRRGARAAINTGATATQVTQKVTTYCVQSLGTNGGKVTVVVTVNGVASTDLSTAPAGAEMGVTVSIPYSTVGVGFYSKLFTNKILKSTCVLEHE